MATKTTTQAAESSDELTPNPAKQGVPGDVAFLRAHYPHERGETVQVTPIMGSAFRVNVRGSETLAMGLTLKPIKSSRFVYVDRLNDGSPTIRVAQRQ